MVFFDANILVYTQDPLDPVKQSTARALVQRTIGDGLFTLSTHVMLEFYSIVARRKLLTPGQATAVLQLWAENEVIGNTPDLLFRAFALQQWRQLPVWDALVVQAAIDAGCTTLYSEDLPDGQQFGSLTVVDPFLHPHSVHESAAAYRAKRRR